MTPEDQTLEARRLCAWLLELRGTAGLSQLQAAEAIGVSAREIRRWEKANAPGGVTLLRLLSAYGVRFEQAPPSEIPGAVNAELRALRLTIGPLGTLGDKVAALLENQEQLLVDVAAVHTRLGQLEASRARPPVVPKGRA